MPKFRERAEVRIGRPIDVSRYRGKLDDRLLLRQITDEVMFEIAELSGQTYVNVYSGDPLPESIDATPATAGTRAPQAVAS
jgi:1-acyl-sn-glycerol-3-phosphate acyltransferase